MKYTNLLIAGMTAGSLALSSCTTTAVGGGQQQSSNTLKGLAIGTAGGAALGALIGNNRSGGKSRQGAVAGALGGAAIGALIGNYMDQQEAKVRQQLAGSGVGVTRDGNNLILNMPSDITFNSGQSTILPQFASTLSSVASVINQYNKTTLSITGHTDSDGTNSYNQGLSIQRANSVASYLVNSGVAANRLVTAGKGESQPVASNNTAAGKAQNRRVELYIIPQNSQF